MNFSHGSYEYHQSVIDNTRKMVARMISYIIPNELFSHSYAVNPNGRPVAIALDTASDTLTPCALLT